jgi:hypothetical protein
MFPAKGIEDLAERFGARNVSRAEWTHEAHLAVGLWHVARFGADEALSRLRSGIRALNETIGVANTPAGGYHETITQAYVVLIAAFLRRRGVALPAPDRDVQGDVDALLQDPLAARAALFDYWSRERLMATAARMGWVEPDVRALPRTW